MWRKMELTFCLLQLFRMASTPSSTRAELDSSVSMILLKARARALLEGSAIILGLSNIFVCLPMCTICMDLVREKCAVSR